MRSNIIINMYQHSDFLVIFVVASLLLISVITWAFFFSKFLFLVQSIRFLRRDLSILKDMSNIEEVISLFMTPKCFFSIPMMFLLEDLILELYLSRNMNCTYTSFVKERVILCLERCVVNFLNALEGGNIFFSTVISVSPFIGLFGTVWSIIKNFVNFSSMQFINFSVMSSGIAESLVLTGLGLFVAIPAVIMRDIFLRNIIIYEHIVDDCVAYCVLLLKRDIDASVEVPHDLLLKAHQKCVFFRKERKSQKL